MHSYAVSFRHASGLLLLFWARKTRVQFRFDTPGLLFCSERRHAWHCGRPFCFFKVSNYSTSSGPPKKILFGRTADLWPKLKPKTARQMRAQRLVITGQFCFAAGKLRSVLVLFVAERRLVLLRPRQKLSGLCWDDASFVKPPTTMTQRIFSNGQPTKRMPYKLLPVPLLTCPLQFFTAHREKQLSFNARRDLRATDRTNVSIELKLFSLNPRFTRSKRSLCATISILSSGQGVPWTDSRF